MLHIARFSYLIVLHVSQLSFETMMDTRGGEPFSWWCSKTRIKACDLRTVLTKSPHKASRSHVTTLVHPTTRTRLTYDLLIGNHTVYAWSKHTADMFRYIRQVGAMCSDYILLDMLYTIVRVFPELVKTAPASHISSVPRSPAPRKKRTRRRKRRKKRRRRRAAKKNSSKNNNKNVKGSSRRRRAISSDDDDDDDDDDDHDDYDDDDSSSSDDDEGGGGYDDGQQQRYKQQLWIRQRTICFVNAMEQVNAMGRIENLQKSFDTALRLYLMLNVVPIRIGDDNDDDDDDDNDDSYSATTGGAVRTMVQRVAKYIDIYLTVVEGNLRKQAIPSLKSVSDDVIITQNLEGTFTCTGFRNPTAKKKPKYELFTFAQDFDTCSSSTLSTLISYEIQNMYALKASERFLLERMTRTNVIVSTELSDTASMLSTKNIRQLGSANQDLFQDVVKSIASSGPKLNINVRAFISAIAGPLVPWSPGPLISRSQPSQFPVPWSPGPLISRSQPSPVPWSPGPLVPFSQRSQPSQFPVPWSPGPLWSGPLISRSCKQLT